LTARPPLPCMAEQASLVAPTADIARPPWATFLLGARYDLKAWKVIVLEIAKMRLPIPFLELGLELDRRVSADLAPIAPRSGYWKQSESSTMREAG
jgi:hypothetical protein